MTIRWLALVVAGGLAAAALPSSVSAAWRQPVGGASPINHASDQDAIVPSVAAIAGAPYIAWTEYDGTNREVRVSRLNAAGAAWEEVVGGASPINHASDRDGFGSSLAAVGGVPYVAWQEFDGTNSEVRVGRLNAAGAAWEEVVGGASPINHASDRYGFEPSLTAVGGVPYVAWQEFDGTNAEVRVARLNAAGTAWEEVAGGASPINHASDRNAHEPSLTAIGGVPYIAWREDDDTNADVRVSRLEPEFAFQGAVANATGATLGATVHTYGLAYPIGFDYGPALGSQTAANPAPTGSDNVTISTTVGGLNPSTGYAFRPFATAGVPAPRVLGAIDTFTTLAAPRGGDAKPRRAFGRKTLVTLSLAVGRIPANGPVAVRVYNANGFQVTGKLSGRTISKPYLPRKRRIELRAKTFRVAARTDKTVKLRLPKAARRLLRRERALSLRLIAHVSDPAGHTRTVRKTVQPKLMRQRVATRGAQQR
jgi:hypothetical protein